MKKYEEIYIKENKKEEKIGIGVDTFSYINLLDENKQVIANYDYFYIGDNLKIDIKNGVVRIFGAYGSDVYFDVGSHEISGSNILRVKTDEELEEIIKEAQEILEKRNR